MNRAETPQPDAADPSPVAPARTPAPRTSVVIVTWNAGATIGDCLASLAPAVASGTAHVVVVDNASTDGTTATVADIAPWARLVRNSDNRGLAAANNQGIRASRSPFVLISNPDVIYETDTIAALEACMDTHRRAAFAFPRLTHPDGSLQTTAGALPTLADALLGRQWTRRRRSTSDGMWWDGWSHDEPRRVGHGLEASFLARRAAIDEIGLQDERYWLDWEGIDWCARAEDAGWESWFTPDARAVHVGGVSVRQAPRTWIVSSHRSMYRYFADRTSRRSRPLLAAAFGARCAAKLVAARLGAADYDRSHPRAVVHETAAS